MASYDKENLRKMKEYGLTGRSPWGEITEIRAFGDIAVIEAETWDVDVEGHSVQELTYFPYVDGRGADEVTQKGWDKALLIALGRKYKAYPDFANFAALMLRMDSHD